MPVHRLARQSACAGSIAGGERDLRLGLEDRRHHAVVAGAGDLSVRRGGVLASLGDAAGRKVREREVVLDRCGFELRPRGPEQAERLRAGPDGRLDVPRLAVADGEVEEVRGPSAVVEVTRKAARLLEVAERARVLPALVSTADSAMRSRISKSGSTSRPPRTRSSSASRSVRASASGSDR